jgi:phage tail-like protein
MPSTPMGKDPLVTAFFAVDFQGAVAGAFSECTGLGSEHEVVEHKAVDKGKEVIKMIPGRMKWTPVTLKRGITDAMDMWDWRGQVEKGEIATARKNGSIIMFSSEGKEMARWNLVNAWPSKLTGPSADAASGKVGIEELIIHHEGYKRVK